MMKGASIIFVNRCKQVLLCLRDDIPTIDYPNCWDVLGGHVEAGETPIKCIVREMQEEVELQLDGTEVLLFNVYELSDRVEYTFWQRREIDVDNTPLHEGQCLRWFSEDEVRNMLDERMAFQFKAILFEFFEKALFEKDKP